MIWGYPHLWTPPYGIQMSSVQNPFLIPLYWLVYIPPLDYWHPQYIKGGIIPELIIKHKGLIAATAHFWRFSPRFITGGETSEMPETHQVQPLLYGGVHQGGTQNGWFMMENDRKIDELVDLYFHKLPDNRD